MPNPAQITVTRLLEELRQGNRAAANDLFALVYEELHRLAHRQRFGWARQQTLDTTGLLHEAYLKLVDQTRVDWKDRAHFLTVAAKVMRHLLVDYARSRQALKRGGGLQQQSLDEVQAPLPHAPAFAEEQADLLVALEEALQRLERVNERQTRVVECRFFGGMTIEETAAALEISPATVGRSWEMARAWLYREMQRA